MHRVPIYVTYTWPTGAQFSFFTLSRVRRVAYGIYVNSVYILWDYIEYITERSYGGPRERKEVWRRDPDLPPTIRGKFTEWHGDTARKGLKAGLETDDADGKGLAVPTSLSLVPSFSEKLRYI